MKHDLTTGTWQDDTGCPISIVLAATSDVVHLLWKRETRTTINVLGIVSEGGHDNDMSTDRRDVMPGRMGGEEKVKARGEDGRVNHETVPTIKQG